MIISNAADTLLDANPGTLPDLRDALNGWFQQMSFTLIKKSTVDFVLEEQPQTIYFAGVMQPFTARQLQIVPEGQRAWGWYTVHATPDLILSSDDIVEYQGTKYRVMNKYDLKEYGYLRYDVAQDFEP